MNKYALTLRQLNLDKPLREYYSTHETQEMLDCIKLYSEKILDDYDPNDIMKMVKQNVCLDEMMPLAMEILISNAMIKVAHYPGDLLSAVVRTDKSYWKMHEGKRLEVESMLKTLSERIDEYTQIFER